MCVFAGVLRRGELVAKIARGVGPDVPDLPAGDAALDDLPPRDERTHGPTRRVRLRDVQPRPHVADRPAVRSPMELRLKRITPWWSESEGLGLTRREESGGEGERIGG